VKIAIIIISNIIILGLIGFAAWSFFTSFPVYIPGRLAAGQNAEAYLTPPAQDDVQAGYWRVQNDIELFHFSDGTGSPVLVLHGGPGFPANEPWKGLSLLHNRFTFHYYHARGCGKSTRPFDRFESGNYYNNMLELIGALGMKQQIADIERIRRILKQDKLTIIGHSYGGFTAALYALEFPARVDKLILVAPAAVLSLPPADGGLYEKIRETLPGYMEKEYAGFLKRFFDYGHVFAYNEKELAALNAEFGRFYFAALRNRGLPVADTGFSADDVGGWLTPAIFMSLGRSYDYREVFSAVGCPVLIVYGDRDITLTREGIKGYAAVFKNCTVKLIKDAGHHCFNDKPDEFAALAAAFLR
jgi:proline iminopeptidase